MFALSLNDAHDLHLVGGGLAVVTGDAAIAQRVKQHLRFWSGEWFLDVTAGVPWLEFVFVRPFDQAVAEAVIKDAVLAVPGVAEIVSFDLELRPERREAKVHLMEIRTINNETVRVNG